MSAFAFFSSSKPVVPVFREPIQLAAKSEEIGDLNVQLGDFGIQQFPHTTTRRIAPVARDKDGFDFWKRKSDAESALNEFDTLF
jgi:hypothetical protein